MLYELYMYFTHILQKRFTNNIFFGFWIFGFPAITVNIYSILEYSIFNLQMKYNDKERSHHYQHVVKFTTKNQ